MELVVTDPAGSAYDKGLDAKSLGFRLAAKTGSGEIPAESWRGAGPRTGLILFGTGVGLAVASVILATQLAG